MMESANRVGQASKRAIELAYAASELNPGRVAASLYFYNRIPLSRRWRELLPDANAVARFLGLGTVGTLPGAPGFGVSSVVENAGHPVWRIWRRGRDPVRGSRFKVYVSPACADLASTVREVGHTIGASTACAVKVGANAQSLLRPDKLMVYFERLDEATRYARLLLSRLGAHRAHGVPFSHAIGQSGLVSIGFDPPESASWSSGEEGRSWRLWVAECVAEAVLRARKTGSATPIDAVLKEVRARGIHPSHWIPLENAWGTQAQ